MSLIIPDELIEALATVRNDATPEDFVVAGFDADDSLKVIDCGSDGIAGIKAVLPDNDVAYALLRKKFSWEQLGQVRTETIKFIYIMWRPEVIPLRRKMKIGSYDGQIKRLFSSYHTDMEINEEDELSEEIVDEILKKITQTADRVTQRKSATFIRGGNKIGWHKTSDMLKPDTQADFKLVKGANIKWAEGSDEELAAAIAEVRDDKSPIRWCLATYESKDTLAFNSKGEGDVSEMLSHCVDTQVSYGLFRLQEQIDKTNATRFCFVIHTPENVPPMAKAIIATHKGTIAPLFRPYIEDFAISDPEELTEEIAMAKIASKTGTMSHVTERTKETKRRSLFARTFLGGVEKARAQELQYANQEELLDAIADVRNDDTPTNWAVTEFAGGRKDLKLSYLGSGSGGFPELLDTFDEEKIMYGIYRSEEQLDQSTIVKFYLLRWHGINVNSGVAGVAGMFTGSACKVFMPYNDNIDGQTHDEMIAAASKHFDVDHVEAPKVVGEEEEEPEE
mmetsp:Transcript_15654/g.27406  ORF Transcript_15654/g.27406 Transcript_15654/m.27406 type:complete len:507 (+) Transcript_15654:278-1798(+)